MLDLESAIKHCEEVAEQKQIQAENLSNCDGYSELGCLEQASEHRQLAEWLKELRAYREQLPQEITEAKIRQAEALKANVTNENYNPYLAEFLKGYICGYSFVEGIIAKIKEEVNADEE